MPESMPQVRPEELEIIRRAQGGDISARNELIERHLAFIQSRTMLALDQDQSSHEYLSYGVEAFIRAISTYDPSRAGSLLSYADIAIRRRVWRAYWADRVIPVPERSGAGRTEEFLQNKKRALRMTSIHPGPREDDRGYDLADPQHGKESMLLAPQLAELREHLPRLEDRQLTILMLRALGVSLREIATRVGVTYERVRQIERDTQDELRELMLKAPAASVFQESTQPKEGRRDLASCAPRVSARRSEGESHATQPLAGSPAVRAQHPRPGTLAIPR